MLELDPLTDAEVRERARDIDIYARAKPEHKLRLVQAFKANGEIVAMTGDGVNDAPALRAAHIGVAMGGRGTDVAREAAALVLVNDDFASLVAAVRLGRRIYSNIRHAMSYIVAVHIPIAGLGPPAGVVRLALAVLPDARAVSWSSSSIPPARSYSKRIRRRRTSCSASRGVGTNRSFRQRCSSEAWRWACSCCC